VPATNPRRVAAVTAMVLVLAAVVVVAVLAVQSDRGGGSAVPQDRPGTVLLVPGYGGSTTALERLATTLRARGREAVVVPSAGDGTGDLRDQARGLDVAARAAVAAGSPSVDVVGYSAGGVVARIWVAELGGDELARRVVTLGSPHHGTGTAALAAALAPDACPVACRQLVPDGELLSDLEEAPDGPVWTSVWTDQDEVVTPPDSAVLAGAVDVRLQSVCGDAVVAHGELPDDPLAVGVLLRAIDVEPLADAPGPDECSALRAATG
jgi:triacylglycerol lipase